ncbi:MAG: hypothetical protein E7528_06630 [Ruminococcaceae bacterium]|nr:hypothetical protein [Oscillospiraceae bacterium]
METTWIIFFLMFLILFLEKRNNIVTVVRKHLRSKKGKENMTEMIKNYIGKECLIYTCTSGSTVTGIIRSYNDGWIEIEQNGQRDIMNCEYITRIREYPRNKNGKKKSVIVD